MNLLSYSRVQRVRFWMRYGKVVLEVLSACKCNVAGSIKKSVVQRKCFFILILSIAIKIYSYTICINTGLIDDKQFENLEMSRIEVEGNNNNAANGNIDVNLYNNDTDTTDNNNDRIMMKDIIKIVKEGNIEEIYGDVNKYFLFHQCCVMNVLFKTKWKKNRLVQNCFNYTDVSDDAFAFLILENNALRYIDMADENKDCEDYSLPIYTDATGKKGIQNNRNLKGKGWSREGMIRFQKIQMKIENLYENDSDKMELLGQVVLEKYREQNGNGCTDGANNDNIESEPDQIQRDKEDKEWDDFLRRNSKRRKIGGVGNVAAI